MGTKFLFTISVFFCLGLSTPESPNPVVYYTNEVGISVLEGEISGIINLPTIKTQERRFRGSSYRNRSSSSSAKSSTSQNNNQFLNSVVSAHPISFKLPTDISGESLIINQ